MEFNDFCEEFEAVYICRNYSKENGWKNLKISDQWIGKYAEGLPSSSNRKAKLERNPQYAVTINEPGKGLFVLTMKDRVNTFKAVQHSYMNI